jgi:pseudouridine synthase
MPRVYAFHKPKGVLSSTVSERGARPLFALVPEPYRAWFAVGRLDKDSEGLVLLCDDARAAQRLMDPGGAAKVYEVVVQGFPSEDALAPLRKGGMVLDGRVLRPLGLQRLGKAPRGGTRYRVTLSEGVNREIRRLFQSIGHRVRRLARVAVGPVELGTLAAGEGRELAPEEVAALLMPSAPRRRSGGGAPTRRPRSSAG